MNYTNPNTIEEYSSYTTGTLIVDENNDNRDYYSCILNMDDGNATNKFMILQLIKEKENDKYIHYSRYGRYGKAYTVLENKYDTKKEAIDAFIKKFKIKTSNTWSNKNNFVKKNNMYFII